MSILLAILPVFVIGTGLVAVTVLYRRLVRLYPGEILGWGFLAAIYAILALATAYILWAIESRLVKLIFAWLIGAGMWAYVYFMNLVVKVKRTETPKAGA
jgi:hypothetical protein